MDKYFKDRTQAGKRLAGLLGYLKEVPAVVYALPRGGVVVGLEVAKKLNAPLDLIITRKIGHPGIAEYAIGAVAEKGPPVLNREEIKNISGQYLLEEVNQQRLEAQRRRFVYLAGREPISSEGKIAILVDDGIATGFTMEAALKELQLHHHPKRIIVAVPVAPEDIVNEIVEKGIEVAAVITDKDFLGSVGAYYQNFPQISDGEVINLLKGLTQHIGLAYIDT